MSDTTEMVRLIRHAADRLAEEAVGGSSLTTSMVASLNAAMGYAEAVLNLGGPDARRGVGRPARADRSRHVSRLREALLYVQAAATPIEQPWSELVAWAGEAVVEVPDLPQPYPQHGAYEAVRDERFAPLRRGAA